MMNYEYKTVMVDDTYSRVDENVKFAADVDKTMNNLAKQGWEYVDNFSHLAHGSGRYVALIFKRVQK